MNYIILYRPHYIMRIHDIIQYNKVAMCLQKHRGRACMLESEDEFIPNKEFDLSSENGLATNQM